MTENTFFDNWEGRQIDFPSFGPSTWTLTKLISEKNSQESSEDFWNNGCIGSAHGTFLCHDVADITQRGVMKILMQIPCEGSEPQPAELRRYQAATSYEQDLDITSQVNALKVLTDYGCKSTPGILAMKEDLQKDTDSVPGGYIIYILMNHLPGIQLSKAFFWNSGDAVREEIRQAFKTAWLDCVKAGVLPTLPEIDHVFWDAGANKAYIIGFRMSAPAKPHNIWRNCEWIAWEMAKPQDDYHWYTEKDPYPDMSEWKL
ncbi:hypothetical protein BDV24DRAFT_157186 [Aspergillus arachidicola]|uniref:Uncharacterized protein n=1 Tax=Aspergillus arachidicola TaxID=656916 RepID=A0A5N6YQN5_9EURO|nr:hypothetical protein BDV24DRAFT_157186 [Aspergillus arachidicola]